jgi:hypothetical protein
VLILRHAPITRLKKFARRAAKPLFEIGTKASGVHRVAVDTARLLPVRSPPVIAAITLEYRLADAATEAGVGHPHPVGAWPVARSLHRCV